MSLEVPPWFESDEFVSQGTLYPPFVQFRRSSSLQRSLQNGRQSGLTVCRRQYTQIDLGIVPNLEAHSIRLVVIAL